MTNLNLRASASGAGAPPTPRVHHYQISRAHKDAVRAAGFDIADPNRRHPVRKKAERILAARQRQHQQTKSRVDALLMSRAGRAIERTLGAIAAFSLGRSHLAHAGETANAAPLTGVPWQLELPGIAHPIPIWPLLLLGSLILKASVLQLESFGIPMSVDLCFILFGRMDHVSTFAGGASSAVSEVD